MFNKYFYRLQSYDILCNQKRKEALFLLLLMLKIYIG